MSNYKEIEVALEALNKEFKNLDDIIIQKTILYNKKQAYLSNALTDKEYFIKSFANLSISMDKIVKSAQSSTFSDKVTKWTGLFDEDLKFIEAHRSDLLKKKDVKNYTYKRHIWQYSYRNDIRDAIFDNINSALATVYFAFDGVKKGYSYAEMDNAISDHYRVKINAEIDNILYGKQKGILAKRLKGSLLGNGYEEVIIEMNFQNEIPISTLLDIAIETADDDWKGREEFNNACFKDIQNQIKDILKRINVELKKVNPEHAKFLAKHIKTCANYIALLCIKLKEFQDTTLYCYKTLITEIRSILKGLYEYDGD